MTYVPFHKIDQTVITVDEGVRHSPQPWPPPTPPIRTSPHVVARGWPLSAVSRTREGPPLSLLSLPQRPGFRAGVGAQPPGELSPHEPTTRLTWTFSHRSPWRPGRPVLPVLVRGRLPTQLQTTGGGRRPSSSSLPPFQSLLHFST